MLVFWRPPGILEMNIILSVERKGGGGWIIHVSIAYLLACIFCMEKAKKICSVLNLVGDIERAFLNQTPIHIRRYSFLYILFIYLFFCGNNHLFFRRRFSAHQCVMLKRNLSRDRLSTASIRLHAENGTNGWLCLRGMNSVRTRMFNIQRS